MRKFILSFLLFSLIVFVLVSCTGLFPLTDELVGTSWRLAEWSDSTLDPSSFIITARFDDEHIYGTSAINSYGGNYTATFNHLFSVRDLQTTLMGGSEEAMRAETIYLELLQQASKYQIEDTTLKLLDSFQNELLIYSQE